MSVQSQRTGACKSDIDPIGVSPGPASDESAMTQTLNTGGEASSTSGAAADCSMATDSGGGEDSPRDYNKRKYHASKMDLNLKILRDQMANLTSSGSSLSRQLASMHRNIQEIKDDDDGEEADSEYESDDEQKPGNIRDAVDTEDDVNKMSDLEKDYSEPKLKRSVSTSSRSKKSKTGLRDPIANEATDGSQARRNGSWSNSRQESVESYPDSDSECSQCLCCNSMASYSSTPWRYISRGEGSTMDEESDSSEYFSDDSEYSTTTSNMPSVDIHKRLSPFYCPSDQAETGSRGDSEEGRFDDADHEPVVDHRMSPLGCESPRKSSSQPDLPSMSHKSDTMVVESDKPKPEEKVEEATGSQEDEKAVKASSLIGLFKAQESKAKEEEKASVAKAKRVEELRRKNSEIRIKNEQKRRAELEEKLKNKAKVDTVSPKTSPLVSENDDSEKVNVKDRISSFEGQKKTKDKEKTEEAGKKESKKSENVEKGTNTDPDSVQQMPDVIPDVTDEKISQELTEAQGDHDQHKSHKSKHHKIAKTTIEIPVSCLPEEITNPEPGMTSDQPTMMTFQVKAGDVEAMKGPILVSRSPKPKRKMSKTVVRLSSTDASPSSISESTLVPDTNTVRAASNKPSGHSHGVCPHCKKSKPGESKRVVKVLQLQPVPESPELPPIPDTNLAGNSAQVFQQQPGGRVIKMIPSKRPNVLQRQQSSEDGVVFRFNMGMPENAPLQVGDFIRIPIQPQQQYPPQQVTHVQHAGGGGGLVIRTGGPPRRHQEVITFRQSSSRPTGDIRVQQGQNPTSGVTVHTSQPGVRVMPSEGGGVRLVFGS
ncbi:stress response protein nst1-like [Acanthaster planci]|uniref:Stress response protein nst1-like n=1 Tax=Acanthaster planci TaxID=133434 RepID=A0A8B7ZC35_ACAPL|nr:stress response protein nst1-like [Acanthaster planci]